MLQPNEIGRNGRGAEVCRRVRKIAVQNVPGDDSKGYHYIDAYCGKPVVHSISEGGKTCSECEKPPVIGWPRPKVTNAAGVVLTNRELQECGVKDGQDPSLKEAPPKPTARKLREPKKAVEAKVKKEPKKDVVSLEVPLSVLEENGDVARILLLKTIEAFGTLPVTNFAESKRLIKLEEKIRAMLEA